MPGAGGGRREGVTMTRRRVAAVIGCIAVLFTWFDAPVAVADRGGGARSHVVGRGDIVTSILGWQRNAARRSTRPPTAPRCRWRTFGDAELEWFVAVATQLAASGVAVPVPEGFRALLGSGVLPDGDVQARVCDGRITEVRFVEVGTRDPLQILERRMITHLPAPDPAVSPPIGAAVPVGQPVFFSIPEQDWAEVGGSITVDGLTADVRARPVSIRILPGDPGAATTTCDGPGLAFDPHDPAPPRRQATRDGACTVTYTAATAGGRSTRSSAADPLGTTRPPSWIGTITVLWQAEWRTGDGEWTSLGTIPRTRLIERSVREVTTTLERP
ncbi:MAG: hypothetical protein M3Y51_05790 [Actinomycetota bacterium]|nr:hypothetical protein [Actinomycetota bacterium]